MYAIIATGGKQYTVKNDDIIDVELLAGNAGDKITFNEVLAVGEGSGLTLGHPFIPGATVSGEILKQFRGPKLIAFKMKKRKGYRKKKGHRQDLLQVKITAITA